MKKFYVLFILLIAGFQVFAQLKIEGEFRPRAEFRKGYEKLPTDTNTYALFISQRSRLKFNYESEHLISKFSVSDVRIWGQEKTTDAKNALALNEAWVKLNMSKTFSLKAGRQILSYDNERLIGKRNWNQIGAKHDALTMTYQTDAFEMDLVTAFNQSNELLDGTNYEITNNYKTLNILWLSKKSAYLTLSTLHIVDGYQSLKSPEVLYLRYTPGLIINYNTDKLKFNIRGFYQMGKTQTGLDINAYYFSADYYSRFSPKVGFTFGMEYISGDKSKSEQFEAFDILYGGRHEFNGAMDYFTSPETTNYKGLFNPYAKFDLKLSERLIFNLDFHYFMLHEKLIIDEQEIDNKLGAELDFKINYLHTDNINFELGYSSMLANKSMEYIVGGNYKKIGHFAYLMLTVKPDFFKKETEKRNFLY